MFHALTIVTLLAAQTSGTSNICSTQACVVYAETPTDLYQIDPVSLNFTHLCTFSGGVVSLNFLSLTARNREARPCIAAPRRPHHPSVRYQCTSPPAERVRPY